MIYHYAANYWPGMPITESRGCSSKREEAKGRPFSSFVPFFFLQCLPSKYGLKKRSIIRRFFGSNVCLPNRRGSDCFRQASVPWVGIKEAVKDGGLMEKEQNAVCSGL